VNKIIGKDTMQFWLDSLHYGTTKINTSIDQFWADNSLKITPDEQLGLVEKLYFNKLPFQKRTQDIVRKIMLRENNANYKLSYKSASAILENGKSIEWLVGWIEENQHPYFFVLNTELPGGPNPQNAGVALLKTILKSKGFFLGKK
jgi:beta-lactamase class D